MLVMGDFGQLKVWSHGFTDALQAEKMRDMYFARKFDPKIDNAVINEVETHLLNIRDTGTQESLSVLLRSLICSSSEGLLFGDRVRLSR